MKRPISTDKAPGAIGPYSQAVRENLKRTDKPVLFFHGTEDRTVPFYMGEELYKLCPTEKDCLFVPGARHVESMHVDPEGYAEKLDGFIKRYIK